MLTKPAVFLLGIIDEKPVNAYEIIKKLKQMNIRNWISFPDSTVYITLRNLEKKDYIEGCIEKIGKMPDRTVYNLTEDGKVVFLEALREMLLNFDSDTNAFSIAALYMHVFSSGERMKLLVKRLSMLAKLQDEMQKQLEEAERNNLSNVYIVDVERRIGIVNSEIGATEKLLERVF